MSPAPAADGARVALVTGAARGLGRAYCVALARRGYRVAAVDKADVGATLDLCDGRGIGVRADLTDPAAVEGAVADVRRQAGRIDALVNNVGAYPRRPFLELSFDEWRCVLTLNLDTCFLVCRAVAPLMIAQGYGRIVTVSSGMVYKGTTGFAAYIAAKSAIVGLTRVMASELGEHGITVNCVSPGLTYTEGAIETNPGAQAEEPQIARRAIRRRALPEDVVGTVCFFCSDEAAFITGQTLVVDGGDIKH